MFFIGRNKNGLWVAREAEGRTGGVFLLRRSALRFAKKNSAPAGCATMFLAERFELSVQNQGNPLVSWLDAVRARLAKADTGISAANTDRAKKFKGEWR